MTRADIVSNARDRFTPAFVAFLAWVLPQEVEYVNRGDDSDTSPIRCENVPGDSGGLTFAGVDHASHPAFPFNRPAPADVVNAYWADWQAAKADRLPPPLGAVVANFAVNAGAGRAVKLLQQALNRRGQRPALTVDGGLGPVTLAAAVAAPDPVALALAVTHEADAFYHTIAHGHNAPFLRGWLRRTDQLRAFASLTGPPAPQPGRVA